MESHLLANIAKPEVGGSQVAIGARKAIREIPKMMGITPLGLL
jgi:hypothetical protein